MASKKICVYCSSSKSLSDDYYEVAAELGKLIGEQGHELVYGGTDVGMMQSIADAVKDAGGRITGVIPKVITQMGIAKPDCDEFYETDDMSERKSLMASLSNAFVALPGGFGTLEEFSDIVTRKHLGSHDKAIVLLNHNGFYDSLLEWFNKLYEQEFASMSYKSSFFVANNAQEAIELVNNYKGFLGEDKY